MATLNVHDLLKKRALITRESAGAIRDTLMDAWADGEAMLDFKGIEAVTPSFVDELLGVMEDAIARHGGGTFRLILLHPPTRLSSKFAAVGRARQLEIIEAPDGAWIITGTGAAVR